MSPFLRLVVFAANNKKPWRTRQKRKKKHYGMAKPSGKQLFCQKNCEIHFAVCRIFLRQKTEKAYKFQFFQFVVCSCVFFNASKTVVSAKLFPRCRFFPYSISLPCLDLNCIIYRLIKMLYTFHRYSLYFHLRAGKLVLHVDFAHFARIYVFSFWLESA